jgi:hypothetical protein
VLGAGTNVNGSSRWIGSGFLQIQPSELAKVALILYGADLLAASRSGPLDRGLMPLLLSSARPPADRRRARPGHDDGRRLRRRRTLIAAGARLRDLGLIALVLGLLRC